MMFKVGHFVRLKPGRYCIAGYFYDKSAFKYNDVDYDDAKEFAQNVKQAVIYDENGRRLYERHVIKSVE